MLRIAYWLGGIVKPNSYEVMLELVSRGIIDRERHVETYMDSGRLNHAGKLMVSRAVSLGEELGMFVPVRANRTHFALTEEGRDELTRFFSI